MRIAAPSGMPRNTATLLAAVEYWKTMLSPLMTCMKKTPMGAKRTIWRRELTATRMAQYSPSPPARPVQIKTLGFISTVEYNNDALFCWGCVTYHGDTSC